MANTKEVANAAAKWWSDIISMSKTVDEIQVCFFYELLVDRIYNELNEYPVLELESNYRPCFILAEIAEEVAIDESVFDFHCTMVVSKSGVRVIDDSHKYWVEVYPEN